MSKKHAIRDPRSDRVLYAVSGAILFLFTLTIIYPLIFIVSCSFSSGVAVATGRVYLWPVGFTLDGYKAVFSYARVLVGYRNTLFYTLVGTLINVTLTLITAYPLAMPGMQGKRLYLFLFTFTMFFSGGLVPTYLLVSRLRMTNTVWAMLIPGALSVYNMIVTRTFIQSNIPEELLEAARIDGCSDAKFFFKMVLPLSKTIIAVLALMYASAMWNSYFSAFLYLKTKDLYPLQIFLRQILVQANFDSEMLDPDTLEQMQNLQQILKYAIIVVSTAPMVLFYPFVQKYFEKGVMIGSLTG